MDASQLNQLFQEIQTLQVTASRLNQTLSTSDVLLIMLIDSIDSIKRQLPDTGRIENHLYSIKERLATINSILNR